MTTRRRIKSLDNHEMELVVGGCHRRRRQYGSAAPAPSSFTRRELDRFMADLGPLPAATAPARPVVRHEERRVITEEPPVVRPFVAPSITGTHSDLDRYSW